jgi:hypothetical protein
MTEAEAGPYLPEVGFGSLNGRPIISIDEEAAYLDVGRRGQGWTFSLRDQRTPPIVKTSWVTLDGLELLRTSPHAAVIRDELERLYPKAWRLILDAVIGVIQENVGYWPIIKEQEEPGASTPGTGPGTKSGEAVSGAEEAERAELRRRAEELLQDPRLLYLVGKDMSHTIMGEESTRLLVWLLHLTSQVPRDYAFETIVGESAAGKTALVQKTLRYVPEKWWRKVGRISRTALEYLKDQDFQLLWVQEARGGEEAAPSIRLSSADDGGLEVWVTERDPETGRFATTEIKLPGRSVVTTTTQVAFDPQDATRTWLISCDASPEQTGRIIDYKLRRAAEPPELLEVLGRAPEDLAPVVREAVSTLDYEATVVVAYADELRTLLSNQVVRARRDVDKMLGLIHILARVHERQRPTIEIGGRRFIYATATDAYMAFELGEKPLEETLTGLERRLVEAYRAVEKLGTTTNRAVAKELRKGPEYARRCLRALADLAILDVDESQRTHTYIVRENIPPNVLRERYRALQASILNKKVETAFSMMSSQTPTDGTDTHVRSISSETGYFSPITGEWRDWEADTHVPARPPEHGRLRGDREPGVEPQTSREEVAPITGEADPPKSRVTLEERFRQITKVFEESHNQASTDYIASRLDLSSEETEKLLRAMAPHVFKVPGSDLWRFSP